MTYEVVMPQLGLTMTEGSVVSWKKHTGDWVEKGEVLFTVETDKAEMEVESPDAGYMNSILVEVGKKVPVGTVVARLGDRSGEVGSGPPPGTAVVGPAERASVPSQDNSIVSPEAVWDSAGTCTNEPLPPTIPTNGYAASPRARRLAEKLGIDINAVKPSRGKRIVEDDVRRFQEARNSSGAKIDAFDRPHEQSRASVNRMIVARRMTESFKTAPHFYLGVEANAADLVSLRKQLLSPFDQQDGLRLSYTDLFLRAFAIALKENPQVNSYWNGEGVGLRDTVDIGFAVQTADGLLVPVIRKADQLSLLDLARRRQTLSEKAKAGTLSLPEMEGGSATLSNLGSFGVDWFQAILNPPQSVILATGRIARRAMVVNDSLEACPTLKLSLSADHRVLDGVAGAGFLGRIKELIEKPAIMLL